MADNENEDAEAAHPVAVRVAIQERPWWMMLIGLGAGVCLGAMGVGLIWALRRRSLEVDRARSAGNGYDLPRPSILYTLPPIPDYAQMFGFGFGQRQPGAAASQEAQEAAPSVPLGDPMQPVIDVQAIPQQVAQDVHVVAEAVQASERPPEQSIMNTLQLPSLTDPRAEAVRLAQALSTMAIVTVRVVGPAGAYAAFALDPNDLSRPDMPTTPTGNTLIVPSGQMHEMRLRPREVIYAKGSQPGVFVSATSGEAGGRVYE